MNGLGRQLRAAFVLFHLAAIVVAGMPSTDAALARAAWKDPTVQAELAAWSARFGMAEAPFEERLYGFARAWAAGHAALSRPFDPYIRLVGADQSWQMFVAPHMFPTRFEIASSVDGKTWETRFQERSPSATWNARLFGVERLRASIFRWGWSTYAGAYHKGCRSLAAALFAEDPAVQKVRCRFWKAPSPTPAQAAAGEIPGGSYVFPYEVAR